MVLTELVAQLIYKDDPKGKEKVQASVKAMQDGLNSISQGATKAIEGLKPLAGILTGITAGVGATFNKVLNEFDSIAKTSRDIGIGSDAFQEISYASKQAGVDSSSLNKSLQNLSKTLINAQQEGGVSAEMFHDLGISLFNAQGEAKGTEEIIYELANAFESMPDDALRATKAMEIFGKSGVRMGAFLGEGRQSLEEFKKQANDMGLVIDTETLNSAERVGDKIGFLKDSLMSNLYLSVSSFLPEIEKFIDLLREWILENQALIKTNLQGFFKGVISSIQSLIPIFKILLDNWKIIALSFGAFQYAKIALGIGQMSKGFLDLGKSLKSLGSIKDSILVFSSSNPFGVILIVVGALIGLFIYLEKEFQIFSKAWEYFNTTVLPIIQPYLEVTLNILKMIAEYVYTYLVKYFSMIGNIISSFIGIFTGVEGSVGKLGKAIINLLLAPFNLIIDTLKGILNLLGDWLGFNGKLGDSIIDSVGGAFNTLWNIIKGVIDFFYSYFSSAIGNVIDVFSSIFGIFTGVEGATQKLGDSLLSLLLAPFNLILEVIKGILNLLGSWLGFNGELGDSIIDSIGGAFNFIYNIIANIASFIIDTLGGAFNTVTGFLSPIIEGVGGAISAVGGFFGLGQSNPENLESVSSIAQNGFISPPSSLLDPREAGEISRSDNTINNESISSSKTSNTTINISNSVHANDISVIEDVQQAKNLQSYRSR